MKKVLKIIIVILLSVGIVSCKKEDVSNKQIKEVEDPSSASYVLNNYLLNVKEDLSNGTYEMLMNEIVDISYINILSNDTVLNICLLLSDYNYQIISEEVNGNKSKVTVKFLVYDFPSVIKKLITTLAKEAVFATFDKNKKDILNEIEEELNNEIESIKEKGKTKEITEEFVFDKKENEWVYNDILNSVALVDGISGGVIPLIKDIEELIEKFK